MHAREGARELRTLDRNSLFWVSGRIGEEIRVWVGESEQPKRFDPRLLPALLERFRGQTVKIGSSFSTPSRDSVGEWIVEKWVPKGGNPAVYLTAILVDEGYAERVRRGWLRFFGKRRVPKLARRTGAKEGAPLLRSTLLTRIQNMPEEDLTRATAALDEALGEQPETSPFESLRGDPDFILPEHPRPRYRPVTPVRITGRPLSRDVIDNRR